jgi:hypothetical protein
MEIPHFMLICYLNLTIQGGFAVGYLVHALAMRECHSKIRIKKRNLTATTFSSAESVFCMFGPN